MSNSGLSSSSGQRCCRVPNPEHLHPFWPFWWDVPDSEPLTILPVQDMGPGPSHAGQSSSTCGEKSFQLQRVEAIHVPLQIGDPVRSRRHERTPHTKRPRNLFADLRTLHYIARSSTQRRRLRNRNLQSSRRFFFNPPEFSYQIKTSLSLRIIAPRSVHGPT